VELIGRVETGEICVFGRVFRMEKEGDDIRIRT